MDVVVKSLLQIISQSELLGSSWLHEMDGGNLLTGKFLQGYAYYPSCVGYHCNSVTVVNTMPPDI